MNALGDRIRERLRTVGMSQSELARRVGVTQPAINHLIKRGSGNSYHVHDLARELKTSPQYLTGETDDPSIDAADIGLSSEDREWLDLLHALAPADRKAALQLVRTIAHSAASPIASEKREEFRR